MSKIVVIGGGASGIIAALKAAENNDVTLIEKNDKLGKKLLVTGNGRCNYWNQNIDITNYYASSKDFLEKILDNKEIVFEYLYKLGIYPKEKNGYYYPYSNQASSFVEILTRRVESSGIKLLLNNDVKQIIKDNNQYLVVTNQQKIVADKIILAMGSKAMPKSGSDGYVFSLLKDYGIQINEILPALVPLNSNIDCKKVWNGVRSDANVELYIDDNLITSETGEVQFTDYGISGICIFNLSSLIAKTIYQNKKVVLNLNFLPFIDNFEKWIYKRNQDLNKPTLETLLESLLNYKILYIIFKKTNINPKAHYDSLTDNEKTSLKNYLTKFPINIDSTLSFEKAQVCTGGVDLNEVTANLELKKLSNVFIAGETLDVDGKCGGFNLAFAFITGYIIGQNI